MSKILFVIGNLDVGGAERHLVQVLPRLLSRGVEPIVYTIAHKGKLAPLLEASGVGVFEPYLGIFLKKLPSMVRKPLLLPVSALSFAILLLRSRPSAVHFFLPEAYLFGGLCSLVLGKRIRIMSRRSLNRYQLKRPFLAKVEYWLHSHMDAVLGNSKAVVADLRGEGVSSEHLGLLYNGIDITAFEGLMSRSYIRNSLGVSEESLLIVCVANLIPYKGHADLINALGEIRANLPNDWMLALVGRDAGIGEALKQLAQRVGVAEHILWLGERRDALAIYSAAEIGVLCSHEEGFSNSVLEGMASSVAMVVSDVGGNAEAVLDGECGIVVPTRDPSALGGAILKLALDEGMRLRMGVAGSRRVRETFSLDTCVKQYASLYHSLTHEPKRRVQDAIDLAQKDMMS